MKFKRQAAILEIISNNEIKTQEELSAHLRQRGYNTTQATISRDIKELRLIKVASHSGGYQYSTPDQSGSVTHMTRLKNIFRECVVKVDQAQNLVVLKTLVGMANAAAAAIDAMKVKDIVGTLAGDDNILVILCTTEEAQRFCEMVAEMLA